MVETLFRNGDYFFQYFCIFHSIIEGFVYPDTSLLSLYPNYIYNSARYRFLDLFVCGFCNQYMAAILLCQAFYSGCEINIITNYCVVKFFFRANITEYYLTAVYTDTYFKRRASPFLNGFV